MQGERDIESDLDEFDMPFKKFGFYPEENAQPFRRWNGIG